MRASFLGLIGAFSSCTYIVVASDERFSLQKSLRGFLGDTIPDVPFEVTYAEDMFDADVKAAYSDSEDIAWSWDQPEMAPMMITNFRVHSHYGEYDYIYAYNEKDPDVPWSFLKDMDYINGYVSNYFKVKQMGEEEALTKLNSLFKISGKKAVMFAIHGWNYDPYDYLENMKTANGKSDYLYIPIMWNTDRGITTQGDYRFDRDETAPQAATQLAKLESFFSRVEQKKAWLCHSMGCFVTQFFASEVDSKHPGKAANMFDIIFMVAPDLRYDIFNEYPFKAGKDKNECSPNSWNNPTMWDRCPDCRAGGGQALVKLAKGGVDGTNKLRVLWNPKDMTGPMRQWRLSNDAFKNWPLSPLGLLNQGDESDRPPTAYFKDKVEFKKVVNVGAEHSFTFWDDFIKYYDDEL